MPVPKLRPLCSEAGPRLLVRLACFLLLGLASPAWAHPDLLEQIEALDALLLADPNNSELLAERGDLHRRHEDYSAASRDFAAARASQSGYDLLDFYEARLLLETSQAAEAEELLNRYLLLHPQHAGAWILRAEIHLALSRPESAAKDYAMAVRHAVQASPGLYRDWALALVAAGESQWSQAGNVVDTGLERFPQDISLLALGTDIALAENQPQAARRYISRLPEPMTRLGQWQDRIALANCLDKQVTVPGEQDCRSPAVAALESQSRPGQR